MNLQIMTNISKNIVFQNNFFIALDKPHNYLTTPSRMGEADLRPCLGLELQALLGQQIFPVHRLDFEVSGLTLFALQPRAHALANGWFEKRLVVKTYQAITEGTVPKGPFPMIWKNKLVRGKKRSFEAPHGQLATTEAFLARGSTTNTLKWQLHPLTGKPHQLRVHLSMNGFPIWGDKLYGSQVENPSTGIALRSVQLNFKNCHEREEFELGEEIVVPPLFF